MDLSKILSIAGKPGLYQVIGQMKNGVLVESLDDGKRFPAYAHHQLSLLSEISIYGAEGDIPLEEIIQRIFEYKKGESTDIPKNNEEIMDLFSIMVGDVDEERVYPSDAKKVFKWYNRLLAKGLISKEEEKEKKAEKKEAKPAVKKAKAKTAPKSAPKANSKSKSAAQGKARSRSQKG